MADKIIRTAKRVLGEVTPPGDKSISHRAIMLGGLADGITRVKGLLDCDDCNYTMAAFKEMGIRINRRGGVTSIEGKGLRGLSKPKGSIYVGASGTSMRILAGILAGQNFEATLAGDESLSKRPMSRVVEPLSLMGVSIKARRGEYAPITIKGGPVRPIKYKLPVPSAQVKSAVLFAGLYAKGTTRVEEEFKSRDHTERMMRYFGAGLTVRGCVISLKGQRELSAKEVEIPGDISSASFFIAAAILVKGSKIRIKDVSINPSRAGILNVLNRMAANVKVVNKRRGFEPAADIIAGYGRTHGVIIAPNEIASIIDELPIIFVIASLSRGRTIIRQVKELRSKETDRISSMKYNLERMGAKIGIKGDDVIIDGVERLNGEALKSFGDHRTCMSMAIAGLAAKGESSIDDTDCAAKSFPGFFDTLASLTT